MNTFIFRGDYRPTKDKHLRALGLDPNKDYSFNDIKKAYRAQALKYHPDAHHHKNNGATAKDMHEKFIEINEAYEWLLTHESEMDADSF